MLHLRVVSPSDRTDRVCRALLERAEVSNLVVLTSAARKPPGDVVSCDVTRGGANDIIDLLDRLGVDGRGSITAERVDLSLGRVSTGDPHGDEAVVWEELEQRVDESGGLRWSYLVFLIIAVLIAAIGIGQNSVILIVGAMVLGPEFGPVSALCFGVMRRQPRRILRAVRALAVGFSVAIGVGLVAVMLLRLIDWVEPATLELASAETRFIVKPDQWSVLVALLAGVAGILSLTSDKSQALVGVFISVTTVPAASYAAVAAALGDWGEVLPSLVQLVLNLFGMSVSGVATLVVLLRVWGHTGLRIRLAHGHRSGSQ